VDSCKQVNGCQINATVSCGVSLRQQSGQTLDMLLETSDSAPPAEGSATDVIGVA
jgi:hypothetical protein